MKLNANNHYTRLHILIIMLHTCNVFVWHCITKSLDNLLYENIEGHTAQQINHYLSDDIYRHLTLIVECCFKSSIKDDRENRIKGKTKNSKFETFHFVIGL